jgi:hypothetical protein
LPCPTPSPEQPALGFRLAARLRDSRWLVPPLHLQVMAAILLSTLAFVLSTAPAYRCDPRMHVPPPPETYMLHEAHHTASLHAAWSHTASSDSTQHVRARLFLGGGLRGPSGSGVT